MNNWVFSIRKPPFSTRLPKGQRTNIDVEREVTEEGFFFVPEHYHLPKRTSLVSVFRLFVNGDTGNKCLIDNQLVDQPVRPFYFWTAAMIPLELWRKYKTGWLKILNKDDGK